MRKLTSKDLAEMGRDVEAPFRLSMVPGADSDPAAAPIELRVDKILRLLAGKRLVALGTCEGIDQPVILKLFFQKGHWERHILRELSGTRLIAEAKIRTPRSLLRATAMDGQGGALINEYLSGAKSIGELSEASGYQSHQLTGKVLHLISQCHLNGLWQKDIHLENFLLYNDEVYLLDGADVKTETPGKPLQNKTRLNNLALFFAQFPVRHDQFLQELLSPLQQHNSMDDSSAESFSSLVRNAREGRIDAYFKKITRSSTAHIARRSANRVMICDRAIVSREFNDFVENPDRYIQQGEMVKAGNTSTVAVVTIEGKRYILKRYNIKSFLHGVKRALGQLLGKDRALNSWRFALILPMLGVSTARPLMMLQRRLLWLIPRESYFLCDVLEGKTVTEIFENEQSGLDVQESVFHAFSEFFKVMAQSRITHGDLKTSNFIFANNTLYVLDLDAMTRHKSEDSFRKLFNKDLNRFAANWTGRTEFKSAAEQALQVTKAFSDKSF
ncbi:MAG: hypothetical protein JKY98_12100 [Gammaproteobacteria bacterium]|nr:hypothetical protein [Gammaproteobacteria bacterium]